MDFCLPVPIVNMQDIALSTFPAAGLGSTPVADLSVLQKAKVHVLAIREEANDLQDVEWLLDPVRNNHKILSLTALIVGQAILNIPSLEELFKSWNVDTEGCKRKAVGLL